MVIYYIILANIAVILPFAMFYYETDDEDHFVGALFFFSFYLHFIFEKAAFCA